MYVGHTTEDGREQPLVDHLKGVAKLAGDFAGEFGAQPWGELVGMAHDIGKFSDKAQDRLLRNGNKVDHATAGAVELEKRGGPERLAAYCVAGHHGGLLNGGLPRDQAGEGTLIARLKKPGLPPYHVYSDYVKLPELTRPALRPLEKQGFSLAFFTRMLFSCLVDADFLDTESFMREGQVQRGGYDALPVLLSRLEQYTKRFGEPDTPVKQKRNDILQCCRAKAASPKGLYTLTVPTGGGKTISSLDFALRHAVKHGMQRVIYVIPYTSIIEQNAQVFRDIVGEQNVVEHHANIDYGDEDWNPKDRNRLATENWDAPIIVTTNVQFFESLFAAKTSRCRKLHNIANSVVIFDEAQMIPIPYLMPCVRAIGELVHNYASTAVLCSATQPALEGLFPKEICSSEIMDDVQGLYQFFRRVKLRQLGELTDEELAKQLNAQPQVLCITGTRKQAQNLFDLLEGEGCFHLSTLMTPIHRKQMIARIRQRLSQGLPCKVVSTSLIEAGVDVDFPVVYRAQTGLDSQIQAAGRCNREGKRDAEQSWVNIYRPEGKYLTHVPHAQRLPVEVAEMVAKNHEDCTDPAAIAEYFNTLYFLKGKESLDLQGIVPRMEEGIAGLSFPFADVAKAFKLIEDNTLPVLIPLDDTAKLLHERLKSGERNRGLLRKIGPYCVNVYENHLKALREAGMVEPLDSELYVLMRPEDYSCETGLPLTVQGGQAHML